MKVKNLPWIPFVLLALIVGLYPIIYYVVDIHTYGLLHNKPKALLDTALYVPIFYVHITFGGIAMLIGWSQFSSHLRNRYLNIHRAAGKVYIIAVMLSSLAGLFIAFFADGGIISSLGFGALAILWFFTVTKAYTTILKRDIVQHENWMIRNYALTFAAVTLRIYLPFSQAVMHIAFLDAYRVIAWLCWVPNLIIAQIIIISSRQKPGYLLFKV
jgi:uncharacterized membrane protein